MSQFEKDLEHILANDPLGLLVVKPKQSNAMTTDQRLVASFEEINAFVREHGREPKKSTDINERRLFSRLKGLRESAQRAWALKEHDEHYLLGDVVIPDPAAIETIDDVLSGDALGLLGDPPEDDPESIFVLKHVTKSSPNKADHIARRKACKEFDQFEPLFIEQHALMKSGMRVTVPFKSEDQIRKGSFFILNGQLAYVANIGKWEKRSTGKRHRHDARLYCVFENGTESNLLRHSLAKALWGDASCCQIIDAHKRPLFDERYEVSNDDEPTGYIYVLRSLSEDPRIQEIEDLFKIGFSRQPVLERIKNAASDPTFLMADVAPVTHFETYNLNPQQFEKLIHRFFAKACLNLDIVGEDGKRFTPREWFVVPLPVIEQAIKLLISGDIVGYQYDVDQQQIIAKSAN